MTERYQLLYDATEIRQTIGRMASEITARHDGENPLFVPLLRGAMPFASKLMFEMGRQAPDFHPEVDYMMTSRYGANESPVATDPIIITDLAPSTEVEGRTVVIVDDVLDMGETARFVREHLLKLGAGYIELAVLVQKDDVIRTTEIEADYVGFHAPNKWLVGMGMDDGAIAKESYRWREGIWVVNPGDALPKHALVNA